MNINSDINVLGSLPDWSLIKVFLSEVIMFSIQEKGGIHQYTSIKTDNFGLQFEEALSTAMIITASDVVITNSNKPYFHVVIDILDFNP